MTLRMLCFNKGKYVHNIVIYNSDKYIIVPTFIHCIYIYLYILYSYTFIL